jgi:adenylylsulfate kinase-like enzyme
MAFTNRFLRVNSKTCQIDATYDPPANPALILNPEDPQKVEKAIDYLAKAGIFPLE